MNTDDVTTDVTIDDALTTGEVQAVLGLGSLSSARMQIRRWEIEAVGRDLATGQKRWPAGEIIKAAGNRTVAGRPVGNVIAEMVRGRSGGGPTDSAEEPDEPSRLADTVA